MIWKWPLSELSPVKGDKPEINNISYRTKYKLKLKHPTVLEDKFSVEIIVSC